MSQEQGIYVYGFGRAIDASMVDLDELSGIYLIESRDLVAYGRIVELSEYSEEALKDRQDDQAWILSEARKHHSVITLIHQQVPLLPAKFGSAFATDDDVREAIRRSSDAMLDRLDTLEGCDEWAAHVYLEVDDVQRVVLARDPELQALSAELDSASEGRKYMIKQQVQSRMRDAIERFEASLADGVLNSLRPMTVDFQVEPPRDPSAVPEGETEIAQASMLVRRDQADRFIELAERTNQETAEVWLQITGPWPAYSFAQLGSDNEVVRYG